MRVKVGVEIVLRTLLYDCPQDDVEQQSREAKEKSNDEDDAHQCYIDVEVEGNAATNACNRTWIEWTVELARTLAWEVGVAVLVVHWTVCLAKEFGVANLIHYAAHNTQCDDHHRRGHLLAEDFGNAVLDVGQCLVVRGWESAADVVEVG